MLYVIGLIAVAVMLVLQFLTKKTASSFVTRLISGVILVLLALMIIISGGLILFFAALILSVIGLSELYSAFGIRTEAKPNRLELFGYLGVIVYYVCILFLPQNVGWLGILAALILVLGLYVFTFPAYGIEQIRGVVFGILYVGVMLSCVYLLRSMNSGQYLVWLIFLSAWGSDTCAYCSGMLLGKHKMTPVLSPKKTIEGAIGGVAGAVILGLLFALITTKQYVPYMLICLAGAFIAMIGDLAASAIKRQTGIKDYGTLIPGHGGVLDRFDSVIFTAPAVYLMSLLLIG